MSHGRGEEGRDRGAVAELARGAHGTERHEQNREVAAGVQRVSNGVDFSEAHRWFAEREGGVERGHD
jgi:hypothetical protein